MERNISLNKLQSNVTAAELDWCVWLPGKSRVALGCNINITLSHVELSPGQSPFLNCNGQI